MAHKLASITVKIVLSLFFLLFCTSLVWRGFAQVTGATPGPYLALALKARLTPSLTPTLTPTPAYGILLISEVMVHPAGTEPDGEWIELFNSGGATINLSTYKLGDEESRGQGEGMLQFPAGASLAPGQVIVIANKAASFFAAYGFYPDYEMISSKPAVPDMRKYNAWASGSVSLVNSGDEVLVLNGADAIVDSLSWGDSSWAFYPPCAAPGLGATLERYPAYLDTDTAADWREQPMPTPGVVDLTPPTFTPTQTPSRTPTKTITPSVTTSPTYSQTPRPTLTATGPTLTPVNTTTPTHTYTPTPIATSTVTHTPIGTLEPSVTSTYTETPTPTPQPTPSGGWLLISEVLYDPTGAEPDGEWIELYNTGDATIDLASYKVGDEETQGQTEGMYQFPTGATIAAGQVIVIADRADVFTNTYGFYPDYEFVESEVNVPNLTEYINWSHGPVSLDNAGDEVLVLNGSDQVVDAVSWGNSNWAFDPDCPVVAEGHSIERYPANVDTDSATDWIDQALPNPGIVYIFY